MKKFVLLATLLISTVAFAKPSTLSSTSSGDNEIDAGLGFAKGAIGLSAAFSKMNGNTGFGGYFIYQTAKEKNSVVVVNQVMSLGAQMKIKLTEASNKFDVSVSPGFGLHMIKDVQETATKKSDKTAIGPMMKLAAQYKFSPTMALGLERAVIVNWFDEDAPQSAEFYNAIMTIEL